MLKEDIKNFINERIEILSADNKDYEKISNKTSNIFKQIIKLLPNDKETLLFDYEDSITNLLTYEIDESYKDGFCDSFSLFFQMYKHKIK